MNYRFMRIIVFFDLPTVTDSERKNYIKFRKNLIKDGFIMMQESVYTKIALNPTAANLIKNKVRKYAPSDGLIQMLCITEKQFADIEYVTGKKSHANLDSDSRLIIL